MNAWFLAAAVVMVVGFGAAVWTATRGDPLERVVATELSTNVTVVLLMLLTEGSHRSTYLDLALTLALLSFAGSLVYLRFLERWL
jgi:multicomponent Na+:H+ antiporter subunit F